MPIDTDQLVKTFGETLVRRRQPGETAQEQIKQIALLKAQSIVGFIERCAKVATLTLMQQPRLQISSALINIKNLSLDFTLEIFIESETFKRELPIPMMVGIQEIKIKDMTFDPIDEGKVYSYISELMLKFMMDTPRELPDYSLRPAPVVDMDEDNN